MSKLPCANSFEPLIQVESYSDGTCRGVQTLMDLAESGKAGRFCHYVENGFPQWEQACAMEDALIDNRMHADWLFVVGTIAGDAEVKGWMEFDDWVIVPYGPIRKQSGSDIGVWARDDFDLLDYRVQAFTAAAPESGIILNGIMREQGHDILGGAE